MRCMVQVVVWGCLLHLFLAQEAITREDLMAMDMDICLMGTPLVLTVRYDFFHLFSFLTLTYF